jgi:hypothetical protein
VFALGTSFTQGNFNTYPPGNVVLVSEDAAFGALGFVSSSAKDFGLLPTSPAKGIATGGADAGANVAFVMNAAAAALRGTP